jgi:hypothetical protein
MEFLDINLTKDSSLLLPAIHSLLHWRIFKETIVFSGFKKPYKKVMVEENVKNYNKLEGKRRKLMEKKSRTKKPEGKWKVGRQEM